MTERVRAITVTDVERLTREPIETRNGSAGVTGVDFLAAPTFGIRNALPPEVEAWHVARRQAFREGLQRHRRAIRLGQSCGLCGRDLDHEEMVWRAGVYIAERQYVTLICRACRPPRREWHPRHACNTCGRMVVLELAGPRFRTHVFCCDRCASRWHNHQRNQRARQARERVCTMCGQEFVGSRRDATTCSPACRQKAYRLRHRDDG